MNSFAPSADWLELLRVLAIETTLVFLLAVGLQSLTRSALWRRTLWQIAMLVFALLVLGELTGVGRGAALWVGQITGPKKSVSIPRPVVAAAPAMDALPRVESSASPVVIGQESNPVPSGRQTQWGPVLVWLCGSLVVAGRAVFGRLALAIFQRRRGLATDAALAKRIQSLAARLRMPDQVRVLEAAGLASPIAFGLFRPAVGLPHRFSQTFTPEQQDVMLAHELAHLAARDPFWRLLADLASAAMWWHPLVWVARQQLHSATETAADEASLVIADGPATLAECLIELGGRLTRRSSTGWLGIQGGGYRSALARRVERLLKLKQQPWSPPSRRRSALAMITLPAAFVVVALAATAWIIPKALRNSELSPHSMLQAWKQSPAAQLFFAARSLAAGFADTRRVVSRNDEPSLPQPASPANEPEPASPRVFAANEAQSDSSRLSETKEESGPPKVRDTPVPDARPLAATNLIHMSKGSQRIASKLKQIVLSETPAFKDVPLSEVVKYLREESLKRDPKGTGVNFLINPHVDSPSSELAVLIDPNTGLPLVPPPSYLIDLNKVPITVPAMKDVRLEDLLNAITKSADPKIKCSVEDYAIVFSLKTPEAVQLFTRYFRIDPNTFLEGLKSVRALPQATSAPGIDPNLKMPGTYSTEEIHQAILDFFAAAGVDFKPPSSRAFFFKERAGILMVRATLQELELIESAIEVVNVAPPQITIEVKICEVTEEQSNALGFGWLPESRAEPATSSPGTNTFLRTMTGILTDPQFRLVINALEQRGGTDLLTAPRVTTLSGRAAQIQITKVKTVVTGLNYQTNRIEGSKGKKDEVIPNYTTSDMEFGPTVDVTPTVSTDGRSIQMNLIVRVNDFLGYDAPPKTDSKNAKEQEPLPRYRVRQVASNALVWDGQTVVLSGGEAFDVAHRQGRVPPGFKKRERKQLLVFVTPTIIDPAGNPIHTADNLLFDPNSTPPQAPSK